MRLTLVVRQILGLQALCLILLPGANSQGNAPNPTTPSAAGPAQTSASPTLLRVAQGMNADQIYDEFVFDKSIAAYSNTKIFWQFQKNGVLGPVQNTFAVLNGNYPNSVFVTIKSSSFEGNDAVITYVQLIDAAQTPQPATQKFANDISLFKVLTDNQNAINSLTSQLAQAKTTAANVTAANNALLANSLPVQVVKTADVESDHAIEMTFTTDKPGRIRVTNTTTSAQQDTQQGTVHTVLFDHLGNSTQYKFTAVVLDQKDNPTPVAAPAISLSTRASMPSFQPQITIDSKKSGEIDIAVVADAAGNFAALTPSLKTAFTISYRQLVSQAPATYGPIQSVQAPNLDSNGYASPDALSTISQFPIPGLEEGKDYVVYVSAVDQFGQSFKLPDTTVAVKKSPIPLDFDGPVSIQIAAGGGLSASWKANAMPKSSDVAIQFGSTANDELRLSAAPDPSNPLLIKLSQPNADLSKVITAAMNGTTPTIVVEMTDPNTQKVVNRQFIFSIAVQNASKSSTKNPVDTASAAQKLAAASQQPGKNKVSWQDLLASGLGIVMKAL